MEKDGYLSYRILPTENDKPTFYWAATRLLDSFERFQEVNRLIGEAANGWESDIILRKDLDAPADNHLEFDGVHSEQSELAMKLTTLVSEAIHHLRAALDYCAHHAAWMDSGKNWRYTYFPLLDDVKDWTSKRTTNAVRGIRSSHLEWVKEAQPFNGLRWPKLLRELSNQDKHRLALQILPAYSVTFDETELIPDPKGEEGYAALSPVSRHLEILLKDPMVESDTDDDDSNDNYIEVTGMLWEMISGVTGVVNKFLAVEHLPPITITRQG